LLRSSAAKGGPSGKGGAAHIRLKRKRGADIAPATARELSRDDPIFMLSAFACGSFERGLPRNAF
jgi:hypothetical protein